jgi:hypothetical protein
MTKKVFKVYWFPDIPGDHEKERTYILAESADKAMNHRYFKKVIVSHAEQCDEEESADARKWHWCFNDR